MEYEHLSVVLWEEYPAPDDHLEQTLEGHEEEQVLVHPEERLKESTHYQFGHNAAARKLSLENKWHLRISMRMTGVDFRMLVQ